MKSKKILSIILSISITIGSIIGAASVTRAADILHGTVSSKQGLNVRSKPSISSETIGGLKSDDSVEILETSGDWYKIKFGSSYGYVSKQYIVLDKTKPSTNNTPKEEPKKEDPKSNTNPTDKDNTNSTTQDKDKDKDKDPEKDKPKPPEYKNFDSQKNVDKLKQWKVKFNRKIKDTEANKNEFKVIDSKGKFVSNKVLIDNYYATIVPWDSGYNYEENYKLIIGDNIESTDNVKLKYTSTMEFTIKSKTDSLGLGKNETEYVHNDKSFDWYISQDSTGKYSNVNSGPSAVAMAIKWTDPSFNKLVADIRDVRENNGSPWSINIIASYLTDSKIKYSSCDDISEDSLKKQLKAGNILITNLNPQYINYNSNPESKLGRFHAVDGNTYTVIIKGYKVVDDKTYFEVYDSFNNNSNYLDGSPKGKNNYYPASEVINSLKAESIRPIIIPKNN